MAVDRSFPLFLNTAARFVNANIRPDCHKFDTTRASDCCPRRDGQSSYGLYLDILRLSFALSDLEAVRSHWKDLNCQIRYFRYCMRLLHRVHGWKGRRISNYRSNWLASLYEPREGSNDDGKAIIEGLRTCSVLWYPDVISKKCVLTIENWIT